MGSFLKIGDRAAEAPPVGFSDGDAEIDQAADIVDRMAAEGSIPDTEEAEAAAAEAAAETLAFSDDPDDGLLGRSWRKKFRKVLRKVPHVQIASKLKAAVKRKRISRVSSWARKAVRFRAAPYFKLKSAFARRFMSDDDGLGGADEDLERTAEAIDRMAAEGAIPDTEAAIQEAALVAADSFAIEEEWTQDMLGRFPGSIGRAIAKAKLAQEAVPPAVRPVRPDERKRIGRVISELAKRKREERKLIRLGRRRKGPKSIPWQGPSFSIPSMEMPRADVSGLGDWKTDIAASVAGKDLDKLISAVSDVQDRLRETIEARPAVADGYRKAKALYDDAVRLWGPPMLTIAVAYGQGPKIPNVKVVPALYAFETARQGVMVFARQVSTLVALDRVFTDISAKMTELGLTKDADAVSMTTNQIKRYVFETDNVLSFIPEYMLTKAKIVEAAYAEWKAWGVDASAIGDPRWYQAWMVAADKVVPIKGPQSATVGPVAGLGEPLGPLALVLIEVLKVVALTAAALYALKRLIPDQNSKAETARALVLQRNQQKEAYRAQLVAAGKTQAEIDAAMKAFDAETDTQVKSIPDPESPYGSIGTVIGIAVAALLAVKVGGVA